MRAVTIRKKLSAIIALILLSVTGLNACGSGAAKPAAAENTESGADMQAGDISSSAQVSSRELFIAAAASLKPVMEEVLIPEFTRQHPQFTVTATYDSSGKLQTQIENGLDADLFLSAAIKQIDALTEEGLVDRDSVTMLLENQIVLIVPAGMENGFSSFEDIEKAGTIAVGDPDSVPAGQYAKEALEHLGLWDCLKDRFSLGTNVTEVLNWVAEASADAGIVYATDAAATDRVKVVAAVPEGSLSKQVLYPAAILSGTEARELAELFLTYLMSGAGREAFFSYGFSPLAE